MCQHTWFGYAGLFHTPTEGQVQGDDRIGFTTCAGNTSNHLGKVWRDNPCGNPSQLEASSSSVFANKASLLPLVVDKKDAGSLSSFGISSSPLQDRSYS